MPNILENRACRTHRRNRRIVEIDVDRRHIERVHEHQKEEIYYPTKQPEEKSYPTKQPRYFQNFEFQNFENYFKIENEGSLVGKTQLEIRRLLCRADTNIG